MTKIKQDGAAQRLEKLNQDIQDDLAQSLERMTPEEFDAFLEAEWDGTPAEEKARLEWIAKKMPQKARWLLDEDSADPNSVSTSGRRLVAGTTEVVRKKYTEPFFALSAHGRELLVAVALNDPQEIVLIGQLERRWAHLVIGKRRYRLKPTPDADVFRCKGLSRAVFEDALDSKPALVMSIV